MRVVVDVNSGTWIAAEDCVVLNLPEPPDGVDGVSMFAELSDNERGAFAAAWGIPLVKYKDKESDRK